MKKEKKSSVERKIYFYRIDIGKDDKGKPENFNAFEALTHINSLPFNSEGRYMPENDDNDLCCWADQLVKEKYVEVRFGQIRRSDLPQIEQLGNLSDLTIPHNSGLVELIHIVFFPNNIVGIDFNFHGPRISRFAQYLQVKTPKSEQPIIFEQLLRKDISAQLNKLQDVRLFQLKIQSSFIETVRKADEDLGAAFEAAVKASNAQELEVVLRPAAYSRESLSKKLMSAAKSILGSPSLRLESSKFSLRGGTVGDQIETVDILKDQLIVNKRIVQLKNKYRALDPKSAYEAINSAYLELRSDLEEAAGIPQ